MTPSQMGSLECWDVSLLKIESKSKVRREADFMFKKNKTTFQFCIFNRVQ